MRFSPSAKLGSPARSRELKQLTPGSKSNGYSRQRASRAAADVARIRLQNVPSEDEQYEFNRRYSRDLRQRKGNLLLLMQCWCKSSKNLQCYRLFKKSMK